MFHSKEGLNLDSDNKHKSEQPSPQYAKPVRYLQSHIQHATSSISYGSDDIGTKPSRDNAASSVSDYITTNSNEEAATGEAAREEAESDDIGTKPSRTNAASSVSDDITTNSNQEAAIGEAAREEAGSDDIETSQVELMQQVLFLMPSPHILMKKQLLEKELEKKPILMTLEKSQAELMQQLLFLMTSPQILMKKQLLEKQPEK